jgi:hypothetical protein
MMKRRNRQLCVVLFLLGTVVLVPTLAQAQSKYWIEFSDKGISQSAFVPGNPVFDATRASLSLACLHRRSRALHEDEASTITIEDAPIFQPYLDSLRARGIKVLRLSKWSNAVSSRMSDEQTVSILKLPFVRYVHPVGSAKILSSQPVIPSHSILHPLFPIPHSLSSDSGCGYDPIIYEYGDTEIGSNNRIDLDRINVWPLHAMGLDASGIRLGHLDVGANLEVSSLDSAIVLFQRDYVYDTSSNIYDSSSVINPQDEHGTETLSTAMGNLPDTLIGPAYHASVMIAHTENTDYEHNIEEDNYAEALEAFEALGVQITTSSLGYFTFDSGQHSYTYADMNGHTAICTQAVERAAKLGVLVCTAMGNGGGTPYIYVIAPADADSILACGALDVNDSIASFSSIGPTSDGRIKPDICAPGVDVWVQNPDGTFSSLNGTSFATPLTSGACCLIQQAHPEATAQEIRHAVMMTGANAASPNNTYGWGEINAYAAALELGTIVHLMQASTDSIMAQICTGVASKYKIENVELTYFGSGDTTIRTALFNLAADSLIYSCSVGSTQSPIMRLGRLMYYQISALDASGTTTVNPQSGWNMLTLPASSGVDESPSQNDVASQIDAYPNPCSSAFELNVSAPGEWQLVDAIGTKIMSDRSQGPSSIRVSTSQLANGAYYLQFISISGETNVVPVVVLH